ncbi:LuxR C-terminal-related transcriptional regulator [Pseudomonas mangiferae]|uniref:LuxR C-terminal-related transcriptional regulator n=1 Tax=Pseudomonas mangiferae TaxID=2593654 RepID=UPI001E5B42B9|nr:LuxR C-terminal-related transcriptional regulator [Pseudomonas mangiferae]
MRASSQQIADDACCASSTALSGADLFPRPHLQRALADHPHARLILFCALPGAGKSAALHALAERHLLEGHAIAWLTLQAEDDEPLRFARRLLDELAKTLPDLAEIAGEVPPGDWVERLLATLAAHPRRLLLVLDDLHLIGHEATFAALNALVRSAPPGFAVAVGSRTQPPLHLATLRAKECLLEFGTDDLCLSLAEVGDYLARCGVQADEEALTQLHEHTEGWFTGVQLACRWLRQHPEEAEPSQQWAGEQAAMGDYLLHAVLERLTPYQQDTLMALSVASRFNGELANTLTGRTDGQPLLERLERLQMFLVPLDRERQWYRFHQPFADFLQARLKASDPERYTRLHFKASLWFANHRMQALAIEHAYLADDPEMLAALVDASGLELINRGQMNRIHRWRQRVPEHIARRFPLLVLADVWSEAAQLDLPQANRLLDDLLARWTRSPIQAPLGEGYLAALTVKALVALQKDDLECCVALAAQAEASLGQHAAFLEVTLLLAGVLAQTLLAQPEQARRLLVLARQRNHFLEGAYLDMQLGSVEILLALEQGRMRVGRQVQQRLGEQLAGGFEEKARVRAVPTLAESLLAYHEWQPEGLEERLAWVLENGDVIYPIDLHAQGMLALARLQRLDGRPGEALVTLRALQTLSSRKEVWRFHLEALAEEVLMILQEGGPDALGRADRRLQDVDWERRAQAYEARGYNPVRWLQGLTRVRLQQARGRHSEALHEISQLRNLLLVFWHGVQRLRLDLLAAHSQYRLGYRERGQALLASCLLEAEREGIRGLFYEEGELTREMLLDLQALEHLPVVQGFVRALLADWPGPAFAVPATAQGEGLTDREQSIVRLAADGLSNEAIGLQLSLALGTVKWHLHNIYEKLGVRNRSQAIRRVRDLGLLA